jgi:hypothetical protein
MAIWIDKVYGQGKAAALREQAKKPFKLTRDWLKERIEFFTTLIPKDLA